MGSDKRVNVSEHTIEDIEPLIQLGYYLECINKKVIAVLAQEKKLV